ncbi:MAG: acyltransferase [Anaerostipes sp.]|nr:acyltransferase [Anaerostipes sp.]
MIGQIKKYVKKRKNIVLFKRNNPNVFYCNDLILRLPQYIKCGKNVVIGENSRLLCWDSYQMNIFDKKPEIIIGNNVHITRNLTLQCARRIWIGNDVLLASDIFITDYNHGMNPLKKNYLDNELSVSDGVIIKDGVWIGNDVLIMPGVTVGEKSIIGAGSTVTKNIPPYCIAVGNPARVIEKYDISLEKWINIKVGDRNV